MATFNESDALLAIIGEDEDQARAILAEMLPGELVTLRYACRRLQDSCAEEHAARREWCL